MVSVYRITAVWSGFTGAPGYSKFSFQDLTDATSRNAAGAKVRTLFNDLVAYRPTGCTILVNPAIDEFDMATGALLGSAMMTTPPSATNGTGGSTAYAGGSGFCITWNTSTIYGRRRVRGRTYFVPGIACFDTDGTISSTAVANIQTAANTFLALTAPRPNIWNRQWSSADPPIQIGGGISPIDSFTFRDKAAVMRSRRD